ncbi:MULTISPECIES: hypothetical protein [unclassified Rhodanobacter]|uniref:hypothetical protein n=1 Tax=unclassified Rhodanobacter TaxID=2621553 RepID=UPI0007A9D812|nr:hypothetical protein [Rhodanobacter sp. FW510-R10]KZC32639.1 hypothetical protein RhoFW510R10_12050 [Rhodanobacter sp. FW510-R10]
MSTPSFQFKSLREFRQLSEETLCFMATLYIDGVRVAQLENRGTGGPTSVMPVSKDAKIRELIERAQAFALTQTWTYAGATHNHASLDSYLDSLVEDELTRRDLDRQFKRHMKVHCLFLTSEGLFTFPRPYTAAIGDAIRRKHGSDVRVLNELPEAEGKALFEKHAAEQ